MVYGNREFDDALLETRNALESNGFQVIAAGHSLRSIPLSVLSLPVAPMLRMKPSAFHPAADENCVKCGVCAEKCPVGAIPLDNPGETLCDVCINCMVRLLLCDVNIIASKEMERKMRTEE